MVGKIFGVLGIYTRFGNFWEFIPDLGIFGELLKTVRK